MSWSETLLDASFRGVSLAVVEEGLWGERALARHGVPFRDGDKVRDMGRTGRMFAIRIVVYGVNYEIELQNIISAVDTPGPGELIHPIYGSLSVVTQNWDVRHSAERPDYAEISLQFVEDEPDAPFFARQFEFVDMGTSEEEDNYRWQDGIFDLLARIDSLVSEIQSWIGGGWVGLIEKALGLPGIGLRLQQLRSQILGVVSGVASMAKRSSTGFDPLVDLMQTPTQIRAAIDGSTPTEASALLTRSGVPASFPGGASLTADAERLGTAFLIGVRNGIEPNTNALPASMPDDPVAAASLVLVLLVITELALSHAQAVAIIIESQSKNPTLSPVDLEGLVNLTRSLTQASILLHRRLFDVEASRPIIEGLRTIAAQVQARARQVILLSPPMIERVVESPASLRLLAHRWYGDHSRAIELIRLNPGLKTPHNIPVGEVLRAYAE